MCPCIPSPTSRLEISRVQRIPLWTFSFCVRHQRFSLKDKRCITLMNLKCKQAQAFLLEWKLGSGVAMPCLTQEFCFLCNSMCWYRECLLLFWSDLSVLRWQLFSIATPVATQLASDEMVTKAQGSMLSLRTPHPLKSLPRVLRNPGWGGWQSVPFWWGLQLLSSFLVLGQGSCQGSSESSLGLGYWRFRRKHQKEGGYLERIFCNLSRYKDQHCFVCFLKSKITK